MRAVVTGTTVLSTLVRFWASEVARLTDGRMLGDDVELDGVSFDSRNPGRGVLFVAVVGERDGHSFVGHARERGAHAALVSRVPDGDRGCLIVVDDTVAAFGRLAQGLRRERLSHAMVIGITGSVGKTSVKDLTAAALGAEGTYASPRSFNNDQGVPFTVINAPSDTRNLIVEMGMRGFGEIERLCRIARPEIGVVTRVGEAHTERLGGLAGVAKAKGELVEALSADGVAVLNAEDPFVSAMADRTAASVIRYGNGGDIRMVNLDFDEFMCARGTVHSPWGSADLRLQVPGEHMALNALAAVAVAGVITGDVGRAAANLSGAVIADQRLALHRLPDGSILIDDSYNANPTSVEAALRTLAGMGGHRRLAILGRMAEVADSAEAHQRMAALAKSLGVELIAAGTTLFGIQPVDDPVAEVRDRCRRHPGELSVLFKASRSEEFERFVQPLLSE